LGGIADTFSGLALLSLLGAGFTLYQLGKNWRTFWNDRLSPQDRQLAVGVAFFILVPVGVLLHEFGHMVAAWSTNSQVLGLHYFVYWGYVEYIPAANNPLLEWYVSLAGNFVSYVLGIVSLAIGIYATRLKEVVRVMLAQLGVLELAQTLVLYPLLSLDPAFDGDWDTIYSFRAPLASGLTLAVHLLSLAAFILLMQRNREANRLLRG
jgi:hypothetical protein